MKRVNFKPNCNSKLCSDQTDFIINFGLKTLKSDAVTAFLIFPFTFSKNQLKKDQQGFGIIQKCNLQGTRIVDTNS